MQHDYFLTANLLIRDGLARIEAGAIQLAVIVDDDQRLVGVATDGDIRRGLLRGLSLESGILDCANRNPIVARLGTTRTALLQLMKDSNVHHIPLIDDENRVVEVAFLDNLLADFVRPNSVVLMVGGLGKRLGELTRTTPKPMLPVGGRPLLELIIESYCLQGFRKFTLAINYHGGIIENHFGSGGRFGCEIEYVREERPLGTAGALSLLGRRDGHPMIVSNGDLLHHVDLGALLDHHVQQGAVATMAVRAYDHQIPYGVVTIEDGSILAIEEKPIQKVMVSGGLYALSPDALGIIPSGQPFDMPDLFRSLISRQHKTAVFPIDGYWLDIGRVADYERAQDDFAAAQVLRSPQK